MTYKIRPDGSVLKDGTLNIPADLGNADYREYLAWAAQGNEPEPYTEPELTYAQKRSSEYPTIGDQLDMLYWDRVNGTTIWQDAIAAIKAKYPK